MAKEGDEQTNETRRKKKGREIRAASEMIADQTRGKTSGWTIVSERQQQLQYT
jgi:hypothetical protein